MENKIKLASLKHFQSNCFKVFRRAGFAIDTSSTIFGIIIEMRNVIISAEKEDTILLHKNMGLCAECISNYATINGIELSEALDFSHAKMMEKTLQYDLEYYLEAILEDMTFIKDMNEDLRISFIQKCWVSLFPIEYGNDYLKIDRILKTVVSDNKIKFPQP